MRIYSTERYRERNPHLVYVECTFWKQMRAKLLQRIKWFEEPQKPVYGIVVGICYLREFKGTRLVGDDLIEVYHVALASGEIKENCCSFLNIDYRYDMDLEELLTHANKTIRKLGNLIHKHPELKSILDYEIGIGRPDLEDLLSQLILCTNPKTRKTLYEGTELEHIV